MKPSMRSILVLVPALLAACGTDDPAPSVIVRAATPDALTPSDDELDDLTITVDYDDLDGDLGEGLAEVHDCRADGLVTELMIPAIAPPQIVEAGDRITGSLDLHVNDVGTITLGPQPEVCADLGVATLEPRTAVFCVVLVDAKGHRGLGDCTPTITLAE
jgi:hypothetical protein